MSIVPEAIFTGMGMGVSVGASVGVKVAVGVWVGMGVGVANAGTLHASKKMMLNIPTTTVCFRSIGSTFLKVAQLVFQKSRIRLMESSYTRRRGPVLMAFFRLPAFLVRVPYCLFSLLDKPAISIKQILPLVSSYKVLRNYKATVTSKILIERFIAISFLDRRI